MAYTKIAWQTGDVITADKLNHLEDGVVNGGGLVVTVNDNAFDKAWQEVYDAMAAGKSVYCLGGQEQDVRVIVAAYTDGTSYCVESSSRTYETDSADGYPSIDTGDGPGGAIG